ncbi:MAG: hypothetical protein ABR981_04690 [Candidatus Micrarchaeaceae archaeon]|jgi:chromosome segregation ATPase
MSELQANQPQDDPNNPLAETRTSIDTLLELLRTRGKSELSTIAISLNIDPRILENWAKVLESGNLVKISYEVGKMYLEPVTLSQEAAVDLKTKTELNKILLEEDLAIEKISVDKFSKNIEELNGTIGSIEKMYQQKMPDVHKMLGEVERLYAPVDEKKKDALKIKAETERNYTEVTKKINELYTKLNSFSPKQAESDMASKFEKLNGILSNIDYVQNMINEMEKNKNVLFSTISSDIDNQVKEFRHQLNDSKSNIDKSIRANSRQLNELIKSIKEQISSAKQVSKEVDSFRKEFETSKHNLDSLNTKFSDKYQKIIDGMGTNIKMIDSQSMLIEDSIKTIRQNMGEVTNLDESIRTWRKNMNEMSREITLTRTEILKLTNQLNMVDSNKNLNLEKKAKMTEELSKEGKATKDKVNRIKKVIKDTADDIRGKAESK